MALVGAELAQDQEQEDAVERMLTSLVRPDNALPNDPTLADVLARLVNAKDLTPRQQQDYQSAVRSFARCLGEDPACIPANRRALAQRRTYIAPAAHGISRPAWSNICSRLDSALDRVLPAGERRRDLTLEPEWQDLQKRIDCQWTRKTLSRFFQSCGQAGIVPTAVDEAAMEHFADYLDRVRLKSSKALRRDTRAAWNRACRDVPDWPGRPLATKPKNKDQYARPWEAFPASLYADVQKWLARRSQGSAVSFLAALTAEEPHQRPRRTCRPRTLNLREYQIRAFASALVERGVDPASLKTLADLVRPTTMQHGLEFHLERHQNRANPALPGLVAVLQSIARDWVNAEPDDLTRIQSCLAGIRADLPRRGMTRKNLNRLRPFDSRDNALALLRLPSRLYELAGQRSRPDRAALMVQDALAIEILLMALLRIGNLAALDTVRHMIPVGRSRGSIHLVIPGNEVKTGHYLEYPLPGPTVALLRRYQEEFRPVLAEHGSTALFPGHLGRPRNPQAFGRRISAAVFEHTQLRMNPHLFRHTMGKLFLKLFPKDYETLRIVYGHRTLETTKGYYVEVSNAIAIRHFNDTILNLRGGVAW